MIVSALIRSGYVGGELGHVRLVRIGIQISDPSDPSESTGHFFGP